MRVGLIIYGDLHTVSGGYLYDRQCVAYLRSQGDELTLFSLPWRHYMAHLADNWRQRALLQRLSQAPLDVLLQDELNHPSLFWLNRNLQPRVTYPIVSIVHHLRSNEPHPWPLSALYRRVERSYLRTVDAFIFNSQHTRQSVAHLLGSNPLATVAYPAGDRWQPAWDAAAWRRRALQDGPLRLLFVGNVTPRKGLHVLLADLAGLPAPAWRLQIVGALDGDAAYVRRVQRQIRALRLQDRVDLAGQLDDEALGRAFASSHVLVVPSLLEGFGIVYLEAFSFGLPVIASAAGGAVEIVEPGRNGFLVAPGDVPALRSSLQRLLNDRDLLVQMGINARARFEQYPRWEETGARIRTFLHTLAAPDD